MDRMHPAVLSLMSGGAASATAKTAVAPFERVKLLLQVGRGGATHPGVLSTLSQTVRTEGARALWRGNGTNCVRIVPTYALRFAFFDRFRDLVTPDGYGERRDRRGRPLTLPLGRQMAAAALSGAATMVLTHPLDNLRTRISTSATTQSVRATVAQGGLYRGIVISLVEITPYIAISLGGFEWVKAKVVRAERGAGSCSGGDGGGGGEGDLAKLSPTQSLAIGWGCGLVASLACYPLDTVKRRLMVAQASGRDGGSVRSCCTRLWAEGGGVPALFYRGCAVNALKSSPAAAMTFTFNDMFKTWLGVA